MGRWAEVYFTNPPEKRGQAISELLRELQNNSPSESAAIQVIDEVRVTEKTETAAEPDPSPTAAEPLRTCSVCAHNNSAEQRFCGNCGAPLETSAWSFPPEVAEALQIATVHWNEPEPSPRGNPPEQAIEPAAGSPTATAAEKISKPSSSFAAPIPKSMAVTRRPPPWRKNRPRGRWCRVRSTSGVLASATSGTWGGCTTP